jgi:hypothetical protein
MEEISMFGNLHSRSGDAVMPLSGLEALEQRTFMSVSPSDAITIGPPPSGGGTTAVVVTLSPQQTETGTPLVSVVVNVPDEAPPKPTESLSFNFVKVTVIYTND